MHQKQRNRKFHKAETDRIKPKKTELELFPIPLSSSSSSSSLPHKQTRPVKENPWRKENPSLFVPRRPHSPSKLRRFIPSQESYIAREPVAYRGRRSVRVESRSKPNRIPSLSLLAKTSRRFVSQVPPFGIANPHVSISIWPGLPNATFITNKRARSR